MCARSAFLARHLARVSCCLHTTGTRAHCSQKDVFKINADMLSKLLAAMNECSEWGLVSILDCLAKVGANQQLRESALALFSWVSPPFFFLFTPDANATREHARRRNRQTIKENEETKIVFPDRRPTNEQTTNPLQYTPDGKDAEDIVERVAPRLKAANSAVAMSAVKAR